jgi:hypothetical protein
MFHGCIDLQQKNYLHLVPTAAISLMSHLIHLVAITPSDIQYQSSLYDLTPIYANLVEISPQYLPWAFSRDKKELIETPTSVLHIFDSCYSSNKKVALEYSKVLKNNLNY